MPDRSAILAGLTQIAERASLVAMFWHLMFAAFGVALWLGLRPSRRALALAISAPLASAALCAAAFANPFNALVLGAGVVALALLALGSSTASLPATAAHGWARGLGTLLLAFGVFYPHFLQAPAFAYVYAAPLGTIPCPSLSAMIGVSLLGSGLVRGGWSWLLAALGAFYGAVGVLRLEVTIDGVLLIGALGLLIQSLRNEGPRLTRARPLA